MYYPNVLFIDRFGKICLKQDKSEEFSEPNIWNCIQFQLCNIVLQIKALYNFRNHLGIHLKNKAWNQKVCCLFSDTRHFVEGCLCKNQWVYHAFFEYAKLISFELTRMVLYLSFHTHFLFFLKEEITNMACLMLKVGNWWSFLKTCLLFPSNEVMLSWYRKTLILVLITLS
jgi:hypothetical protein